MQIQHSLKLWVFCGKNTIQVIFTLSYFEEFIFELKQTIACNFKIESHHSFYIKTQLT